MPADGADVLPSIHDFNVKFSTREGYFDLLGSNIGTHIAPPVRRFTELLKSDERTSLWYALSNLPAALPAVLWAMSERAVPRSFRMMQGFGSDLLQITSAIGEVRLAKFQWLPLSHRHLLLREEATCIADQDPEYLRRDLYDAIINGHYPAWELGVQILSKAMPEGQSVLTPIRRMVLDRIADNAARDTQKFIFSPHNVVSGIDLPTEHNSPTEHTTPDFSSTRNLDDDHFAPATFFWNSLTLSERARIVLALSAVLILLHRTWFPRPMLAVSG